MVVSLSFGSGLAGLEAAVIAGAAGGFASGFAGSLLNGGSIGDAFKAGLIGGLAGGITAGIGQWGQLGYAGTALADGVVNGGASEAEGGQFRNGFYSGVVEGLASPKVGGDFFERIAEHALIGGTASVIGGGKFENGAATDAFNAIAHDPETAKALGFGSNQVMAGSRAHGPQSDPRSWNYVGHAPIGKTGGDLLLYQDQDGVYYSAAIFPPGTNGMLVQNYIVDYVAKGSESDVGYEGWKIKDGVMGVDVPSITLGGMETHTWQTSYDTLVFPASVSRFTGFMDFFPNKDETDLGMEFGAGVNTPSRDGTYWRGDAPPGWKPGGQLRREFDIK